MLLNYLIPSLAVLNTIIYGYCVRKWFRIWWPLKSYSAHALFLSTTLMFVFSLLNLAQAIRRIFDGKIYTPFTLALIFVIFIHALVQLALALGYFSERSRDVTGNSHN